MSNRTHSGNSNLNTGCNSGIDVVRNKIKAFAQKKVTLPPGRHKIVILDEADRLMELGFEVSIKGIIKGLDGRRKLARQAVEEGKSMDVGGWDWERRRRTVCS